MKNILVKAFVLIILLVFAGCSTTGENTITQISTIDALLAGAYDGSMTCGQLLKHGDFGIGTFEKLDGEMIIVDGKVYQVKSDGKVYIPASSITTPFAVVCRFEADHNMLLNTAYDYQALKLKIDQAVPNQNIFCAIKVHGIFSKLKARSVPAQQKPYPPLSEVVKHQTVFEFENLTGTMVGYRCPPFVKGINVPHYHLHFISDDSTQGGHILDFLLQEGIAEIDVCNRLLLILPEEGRGLQHLDLSRDRSADLEEVEK